MKLADFFSLPMFLSVLLHALIALAIILKFDFLKEEPEPYKPHFVTATLVDMKPKAKAAPQQPKEQVLDGKNNPELKQVKQQKEQQAQEAETKAIQQKQQEQKEKAETEQKIQNEKLKKEKAKKEADEKAKAEKQKKLEEEQKAAAEAEKRKKAEKQRREELKALEAQMQKEEQMLSSTVDDVSTKSYEELIAERVRQNWSRPPSARNGMTTILEIRMLPTGQVMGVRVTKSSGDAAFDRAAEQAVKRVDRFEEVKNIPPDVFEKYFRQFLFTFRPEDLRQ
ncbi:cell envelope integrity protein TolA [Cellvibrio sp.]|uniref:cell envelope integrity protein TolA n=1 Tax=Cellvibrio sp. TaxID=1965322 RepID=UPI00396473F6